jgi:hypothetical protein
MRTIFKTGLIELLLVRHVRHLSLASVLVLFAMPSATAAELGRLFFTPEQRSQLNDSLRRSASSDQHQGGTVLNGIVQKHGGKRTIWINGVPQPAGKSDERSPESVTVPVPGKSKSIKLKVGERVLPGASDASQ